MNKLEEFARSFPKDTYVEVPFPPGIAQEIVSKALAIEKIYYERGYGISGTPNDWEVVAQTTAKLRVVVSNPELHDPDGIKRRKYEATIEAFNLEVENFPPNFDVKTGTYTSR